MATDRSAADFSSSTPKSTTVVEEGGHYVFHGATRPPYEHIEHLGHGGSASVDSVRDIHTGTVYARKTIILRGSKENTEGTRRSFHNEIDIIRGLGSHPHIVQVFATYYQEPKLCLILHPVADGGDLDTFIHHFRDYGSGWDAQKYNQSIAILQRAFGCLASGLAFMHRKRIRHKDINGRNILVHQGSVTYTDFGISKDFSAAANSTTDGTVHRLTRRYSAPEILGHEKRNSKSDVFSLGCVYLELLSALTDVPVIDYEKAFAHDLISIGEQVRGSILPEPSASLASLAVLMVSEDHTERPTSHDVENQLRAYPTHMCDGCQITPTPDIEPAFAIPPNEQLSRHTTFDSSSNFLGAEFRNNLPDLMPPPSTAPIEPLIVPYMRPEEDAMHDTEAPPIGSDPPGPSLFEGDGEAPIADGTKHGMWTYSAANRDWWHAVVNTDNNSK
jgi:serine/threonine protein kinase